MRSRNLLSSMSLDISESKFGSPMLSMSTFNALAIILAVVVFPTPLGPVKRYA